MDALKKKREIPVITIKFLLVALAFLGSVFVFAAIAHEAVMEKEAVFDQRIADYLSAHASANTISIMRVITFFGSTGFLLPAYLVLVIILMILHRRRDAINTAIVSVTSSILLFALKDFFKRVRPNLPLLKSLHSFSFPSGHALSSFIFCSMLGYLVWNSKLRRGLKWAIIILLVVISFLIGISRIILRMHYATDVIAGFCLGIAWVILSFWIMRKTEERKFRTRL